MDDTSKMINTENITVTGIRFDLVGDEIPKNEKPLIELLLTDKELVDCTGDIIGIGLCTPNDTQEERVSAFLNIVRYCLNNSEWGKNENLIFNGNFMEITMPCGEKKVYKDITDFKYCDEPCICGNPKHHFVKYSKNEKTNNEK